MNIDISTIDSSFQHCRLIKFDIDISFKGVEMTISYIPVVTDSFLIVFCLYNTYLTRCCTSSNISHVS